MGALATDVTPERNATAAELEQFEEAREQISQLDTSNTFDASNPHHRLFVGGFDGTRNNRYNPNPANVRTNPDVLEKMVPRGLNNVASEYIPGVASNYKDDTLVERLYDSATGNGCAANAQSMYRLFVRQAQTWLAEDPKAEIHVSNIGFSRGSATAREFSNLVYERGIPTADGKGYLVPPGEVHQDLMLLYDTVATGQESVLNLGIPPDIQVVHFVANDENRNYFPLSSVKDIFNPDDKGLMEIELAGAHSDMGGGTEYGGLSARTLELGAYALSLMGVPLNEIPEQYKVDPDNITVHDSGDLTNFESFEDAVVSLGNWEFAADREIIYPGNPERRSPEQQAKVEAELKANVKTGENVRAADLQLMQAKNNVSDAFSSGNTIEIVRAGLEYYSSLEKRSDLGADGRGIDKGSVSESTEALVDSVASAILLGQVMDSGDGLAIAGQSIKLLQDIDKYVFENSDKQTDLINDTGAKLLGLGAAGIGLAQAIEADNEWGMVQSSAGILEGINNYLTPATEGGKAVASSIDEVFGASAGATGQVLAVVGSAIGLAMNIAQLDDVFESGDAGAIACTVTSTVNNAINTYNTVANLAGATGIAAGNVVPVLGFITAGIQLMQGDVVGAVFSAASAAVAMAVAAGLMTTGVGAIAGLAIMAVQMLISDNDPPEATATFTLDENGNVVMDTHGDSAMLETAEAYGSPMIALMENFQKNGGRLMIDGMLPKLRVVQGEDSTINYRSDTGGAMSVMVSDPAQLLMEMSAALYARDRGDRLDSAIDISRDALGEIDFAKVDRIMAGYGFSKRGMTYTYGETKKLNGISFGSGVFNGGGNVGPQGQHFVAKDGDIKSLPLREEQRPSQTMGEIARVVGLNNAFAGAGAELLAMAMISGGLLGLAAPVTAAGSKAEGEEVIKPLDSEQLVQYLSNPQDFARQEEIAVYSSSRSSAKPAITDAGRLEQFLKEHWGELLKNPEAFSRMPESAHFQRQQVGYHELRSDGSRPGWIGPSYGEDDPLLRQRLSAQKSPGDDTDGAGEGRDEYAFGRSFSGHRVYAEPEASTPGGAGGNSATDPVQPAGPQFIMAEDSILRFLLTELLEDTSPGSYAKSEETLTFVDFGRVENGRIYREANGDIRFEPAPGFTGTCSFSYTVRNAAGEVFEKQATIQVKNVNDAPLLQDDAFTLDEGEPFYLDTLLVNDADPEGDTLTLDHLRGVEHGEIALLGGRLAFIPEEGFHGDVAFSYWVYDQASAYPVMAYATLSYVDVNTPASVGDDRFLVLEDHSLTVTVEQLLVNDLEHDGENLTFAGLSGAAHGKVEIQPDGTILFTPDKDYAGSEAGFGYLVTDDSGNESTGWVAVEVLDAREAPVVSSESRGPILEDEILTFTPDEIARFVHDADGDQLHLDFITNVKGGTIVTANGYYSFIPDPDYSGPASFDYRANDNHRGVVDGHLEFDILPVNDPIAIGEDVLDTLEDQPVTVQVEQFLANDYDVDGATIDFVGLGGSAHGSASMNPDGTVSFTPEADYAGSDAGFEYIVRDDAGLESTGWVRVRVEGVNDAPAIVAESLETLEDQPLAFDAATLARLVRDADNDTLQLTGVAAGAGGTVSEQDSLFTFTPDPNFHGKGALELTVADQHGAAVTVQLSLDILSVDDPTVFGDHLLKTMEEEPVATTVAALLAGDQDDDGPLSFVRLGEAFHGTVELTPQDEILFTPDQDYFGSEAGFTYVVSDPDGYEATGRVRIEVENVNDAPVATAKSLTGYEDQPIAFTAATLSGLITDSDGDPLALSAVTDVTGGTVSESGGVFTFTPTANYHGPASLGYAAHDGHGGQVAGTLRLDLLAVDDPTVFGDHAFVTDEEQPFKVAVADLLAGDADPDGPLTFIGPGAAAHGQVRLAGQTLEFLPDQDYFGDQAGFSYQVEDAEGNRATGWVKVEVANVNDEPVILADRLHLQEDQTITFDQAEVAKFLHDADGDPLSLELVENVTGGKLTQQGGVYTFIPDPDFYGEAGFDYLAKNTAGEELAGKLAIAVSPVNDLPKTTNLVAAGLEDHEVTMTVAELMAGASDVEDGPNLAFAGIHSSLNGGVYVDSDQVVHFLPNQDFFGSGFFRYTVVDSEGGIGLGLVAIDFAGENDAPVAVDDVRIVAWSNDCYENVYLAETLLANDFDVDGDPLHILATGPAEYGTVSVDAQGNIHYLAKSDDWVGVDRFSYQISDGHGATATATAQIDVKINTSPDIYSELLFTKEDIVSIISQQELLANDSDIDGDSLRIMAVDQAEHCSVNLLADGGVRFTPEPNFNNNYPGQASFRYTVTDGISEPVTGVAFFDIEPVNDSPILTGERIEGAVEDNSFSFTVAQLMANDTDVEMASPYEEDAIHFTGVSRAGHGQVSWDPGSGTIYYVPDANFCGVETFSYAVTDSFGATSTVTSEIYVQPVNDYPVVQEDIGSTAEDSIWNYYSIAGLVANDYDVDGDALTIVNPYVIDGNAQVSIAGGNLMVKPAWREDRVVVGYTVSDGHGGEVASKLTMPHIREHNFAPTFSGIYRVEWENSSTVWFNFHAEDKNGGNTWSNDSGDIVSISGSAPNGGQLWDHGYSFRYRNIQSDFANGTVVLTAVDRGGATGSIFVRIGKLAKADGNYVYSPVVLDLDGDGVELLGLSAGVSFDWNRDGSPEPTGWVGADDGFLVYDYDHDRTVRYASELALREYDPEATTDLEGLRAFDTDNDGRFTPEDAEWQSFGVWRDKNTDGLTDEGEFHSLGDLGISAINLQSDENFHEQDGNIVYGTGSYETENGASHQLADVGLGGESLAFTEVEAAGDLPATGDHLTEPPDEVSKEEPELPAKEPDLLTESSGAPDEVPAEEPDFLAESSEAPDDAPTEAPETWTESSEADETTATAPPETPEEGAGQGGSETLATTNPEETLPAPEEAPAVDEPLPFDETEINRQCLQLLSDMADCANNHATVDHALIVSEVDVMDHRSHPSMENEQDFFAIA